MLPGLSRALRRPKEHARRALYPVQRRLRFGREPNPRTRSAIMLFDPSVRYGGWIDRVKGVVSTYHLASVTDRNFRLYAGPTFPIDGLIEPATFDWRIKPEEIRWNPLNARFHVSRDQRTKDFSALVRTRARNVFVDTNLDYLPVLNESLDARAVRELWARHFRALFKPARALAERIDEFARPKATAVHARFTGLLGDFRDVVDNALPAAERDALLAACVDRLRTVAKDVRGPLFVFSDSPRFLERAREAVPAAIVLPGTPAHVDRTDDARAALEKTLLDFYVMAACERIVLLCVGPMYRSAFSRYAAYVNAAAWEEIT